PSAPIPGQRHHCVRSAAAPAALRRHVHARLNHPHHQRGSITRVKSCSSVMPTSSPLVPLGVLVHLHVRLVQLHHPVHPLPLAAVLLDLFALPHVPNHVAIPLLATRIPVTEHR